MSLLDSKRMSGTDFGCHVGYAGRAATVSFVRIRTKIDSEFEVQDR